MEVHSISVTMAPLLLLTLTISLWSTGFCSTDCIDKEKNYDLHASLADVVVSGTVKRLLEDEARSTKEVRMFKGELEIKRVFKGRELVDTRAKVVNGSLRQHQVVEVEGLGDPKICDSKAEVFDTKIFMLSPSGDQDVLRLNSSILPVTVYTLNNVDHVINDIPLEIVKPKVFSPCYLYFCPFGGTCQEDAETSSPKCVCDQKCPTFFAPVCGSDGATYANPCMLKRASCIHNKLIKVARDGSCGVKDPCEGHECQFGAECQPSQDGTKARCSCRDECPNYGDSTGSKPICGNDGQDYANMCELQRAACHQIADIKIKYHGKCDPCQGHRCDAPEICQVGPAPGRKPECNCKFVCPTEIKLVCGNDGKSYSNVCRLNKENCKTKKNLTVLHDGKCTPENNPCSGVQCGPEAECSVDRTGETSCVCPPPCEPVLRPVCGNDGVTYDNECEMRREACREERHIAAKHTGKCGSDSVCHDHKCDYGAVCVEDGSHQPVCRCPQCPLEYDPVCGANGITYESKCKLQQENCQREESVEIEKMGACDGECRCEFYAVCEKVNGQHKCLCPTFCTQVMAQVCGSDGVTYNNECELTVESCRKKTVLTIASTGSCDMCEGVSCEFHSKCENGRCVCPIMCPTIREPVCGTNGRTYVNDCEMRKFSCANDIMVEVLKVGNCDSDDDIQGSGSGDDGDGSGDGFEDIETVNGKETFDVCSDDNCVKYGGTCELEGVQLVCSCGFSCEAIKKPVCGSDGRLYGNECLMLHTSCVKRVVLKQQSLENCDEFESGDPCEGSKPLVNMVSGADYDCSPGKDTCPSGTYCHMTMTFSKCCQDDKSPIRECSETEFGCCADGLTPAKGPRAGGCPDACECNDIGSYSKTCDPRTKQCTCKPGVGGRRCDRCDIGYWGMARIGMERNPGCIPCNCNKLGSDRDDCDQMTGRCVCKPRITGMKCNMCSNGNVLGIDGCSDSMMPSSCFEAVCEFGATCHQENGKPTCKCEFMCDSGDHNSDIVCGSDGQNYGSECQLKLFRCRLKKAIKVAHTGPCKGAPPSPPTTPTPTTRSRKTTRHIQGGDKTNEPSDGSAGGDNKAKCYLIDDICLSDSNCCPEASVCDKGLCKCRAGYIAAVDNKDCYENKIQPTEAPVTNTDACTDDPCESGRCVLDDKLGYRCVCEVGFGGPRCEDEIDWKEPSFSGTSFLSVYLDKVTLDPKDFQLDIVFSSFNNDAIVLFASRFSDGSGDFVSLTINGGYVEFRYDLGGGSAVLKSRHQLDLTQDHRVRASRQNENGRLVVGNEEPVTGASPDTHKSLDLTETFVLGSLKIPTKQVYNRIGVGLGLVGCIQYVKMGSQKEMHTYDMQFNSINSDVADGIDITECGNNPCQSMPCQNGGTCLVLDDQVFECHCQAGYKGLECQEAFDPCTSNPCEAGGHCVWAPTALPKTGYYCECPKGRKGDRCEQESLFEDISTALFTADGFLILYLEDDMKISMTMSITVHIRAMNANGIILLVTQKPGGGDFICLSIENKKVVFTFYLGSGIARIESAKSIHMDRWHKVTIRRDGRQGSLQVDNHTPRVGESSVLHGTSSMLNINNRPLYVGGYDKPSDLPKDLKTDKKFKGAIQRVIINGHAIEELPFKGVNTTNISTYIGPPCSPNPCLNGGVCAPYLAKADCRCPSGFVGSRCQQRLAQLDKDQPVLFNRTTLSFPNEISTNTKGQRNNQFSVTFRTVKENGILLLQAGGPTVSNDFLLLAVSEGQVELSYNLGNNGEGELFTLRSTKVVTNGQWHTAKVIRQERQGSLQVDDESPLTGSSTLKSTQLDTDGVLWVGGRKELPSGLPTHVLFDGCIETVEVNGGQLHLVEDKNGRSSAVNFCSSS